MGTARAQVEVPLQEEPPTMLRLSENAKEELGNISPKYSRISIEDIPNEITWKEIQLLRQSLCLRQQYGLMAEFLIYLIIENVPRYALDVLLIYSTCKKKIAKTILDMLVQPSLQTFLTSHQIKQNEKSKAAWVILENFVCNYSDLENQLRTDYWRWYQYNFIRMEFKHTCNQNHVQEFTRRRKKAKLDLKATD